MSGPFIFNPQPPANSPLPPPGPYLQPFMSQQNHSPFIPPASIPFVGHISPFIPNIQLAPAPGTPGTPRRVHFGDSTQQARPRSWHVPDEAPFFWPVPAPPLTPTTLQPPATPSQQRRRSFGAHGTPTSPWANFAPTQPPAASPWAYTAPALPTYAVLNPFLDGGAPRPDFVFDLSAPSFSPLLLYHQYSPPAPLQPADLDQPATHPAVTSMRIVCDAIPEWPIELKFSASSPLGLGLNVALPGWQGAHAAAHGNTPPVPITLRDVLEAVYRALHTQITHIDWARLSKSEEMAISRAYTRRCKDDPDGREAGEGVKRVDFLLDKFMFRGLVPTSNSAGFSEMKLITSGRSG